MHIVHKTDCLKLKNFLIIVLKISVIIYISQILMVNIINIKTNIMTLIFFS